MRNKILMAVAIAILAAAGSASFVHAEQGYSGTANMVEKRLDKQIDHVEKTVGRFEDTVEKAWTVNVGERAVTMHANGNFRVSGVKVNSVNASGNMLNVEFFGFNRDVSVAGAKFIGGGKTITLADFQAGDMLSGNGNFNSSTKVLTVNEVHNLSYRNRASGDLQLRINELLNLVKKLQEQLNALRSR